MIQCQMNRFDSNLCGFAVLTDHKRRDFHLTELPKKHWPFDRTLFEKVLYLAATNGERNMGFERRCKCGVVHDYIRSDVEMGGWTRDYSGVKKNGHGGKCGELVQSEGGKRRR